MVPNTPASSLQMALPWDLEQLCAPTSPMALLTAIVRKEAQLPEHTAAFAAAQLLPIIEEAVGRQPMNTAGQRDSLELRKELLVSAKLCSAIIPASLFQLLTGTGTKQRVTPIQASNSTHCSLARDHALCALRCRQCAPTWRTAQRGPCCWGTGSCSRWQQAWCLLPPMKVTPPPSQRPALGMTEL